MKRIAHRGATEFYPENTLAAFKKAIELGFDGVELDVRRCQSGELVVIHDAQLKRTTNGRGLVSDLSLTELRQLKIGGSYQIPTLSEVIEQILPKTWLDIEIKDADPAIIDEIAKLIPARLHKNVMFSSKQMAALEKPSPGLTLAAIHALAIIALYRAKRLGLKNIGTRNWWINRFVWRLAAKQGISVYIYPAAEPTQLPSLAAAGVIGVIADNASVLK